MADYETMREAFFAMDEATAVAIFEMELNNAAQLRDQQLTDIIAHAFFDCRLTKVQSAESASYFRSSRDVLTRPVQSRQQGREYFNYGLSYYVQHPLRGIYTLRQIKDKRGPFTYQSYSTTNASVRAPPRPNFRISNRAGGGQLTLDDSGSSLHRPMNYRRVLSSAPAGTQGLFEDKAVCISCYQSFSRPEFATSMACKHSYCRDCAQNLFMNSLSDIAQFPASCCKTELRLRTFAPLLTREILEKYEERVSRLKAKKFCSNQICSKALSATDIKEDIGKCSECHTLTCLKCKSSAHPGEACAENKEENAVLALAQKAGWRRCGTCSAMVSMRMGCNHMTCICKAEWCYICGVKWKGCECLTYGFEGQTAEERQDQMLGDMIGNNHLLRYYIGGRGHAPLNALLPMGQEPTHHVEFFEQEADGRFTGGRNLDPTDNPTQTNDAKLPPGRYRARTIELLHRQRRAMQERLRGHPAATGTSATVSKTPGSSQEKPHNPSPYEDRYHSREYTTYQNGEPLPVGYFQQSDTFTRRRPLAREDELRETQAASPGEQPLPDGLFRLTRDYTWVPDADEVGETLRYYTAALGGRSPTPESASRMRRSAAPEREFRSSRVASQDERPSPSQSASRTLGGLGFINHLRRGRTQNKETKEKA